MQTLRRERFVAALVLVSVTLSGCASWKDVSHDPKYLGQMKIGQKYLLGRDAFLWDVNHNRPFFDPYPVTPGCWLVVPSQATGWYGSGDPLPSVEEWQKSGGPDGIRGVVNSGTVVSLSSITYYNYVEGDTAYYVFTILNGPYRGRPVCLNDLMGESRFSIVSRGGWPDGYPNRKNLTPLP
jgi:hypothetical protein